MRIENEEIEERVQLLKKKIKVMEIADSILQELIKISNPEEVKFSIGELNKYSTIYIVKKDKVAFVEFMDCGNCVIITGYAKTYSRQLLLPTMINYGKKCKEEVISTLEEFFERKEKSK